MLFGKEEAQRIIDYVKKNKKDLDLDYDLVFVDGPVGEAAGGIGRGASIKMASCYSDKIILHDAGRLAEMHYQAKNLRGKFKLMERSGDHQSRCHYWIRREKPITDADI